MEIDRENDFSCRTTRGNDRPIKVDRAYVLVILQKALRAEDNPVIDVAFDRAKQLNLGIVVYSELDETVDYASERLFYFILGAFREVAIALEKKNIECIQTLKKAEDKNLLQTLASKAAAIYTDEEYTHWDRARTGQILNLATSAVFLVDASRLVPTRELPSNLNTTPEFRKAHGKLRDDYYRLRQKANESELKNTVTVEKSALPLRHNFARYSDGELIESVRQCNIDRYIGVSSEHPPTQAEIAKRIATLKSHILGKYKWIRNNPALEHSTSRLSPYLHFGMLGSHRLLAEIESSDVPKSYTWKFRDEFLTWREWFHYQAFYNPNLHLYDSLPDEARKTLEAHADDSRADSCSFENILEGNTSDRTWNAVQREWLKTGWLHNNLRMYWGKQILRFTKTPQEAWNIACYLNDKISLDGCDPATYCSIRWAFGDGKPGYKEKPIYGWVATKSDRTLLKREGMKEWINSRL